MIGLHRFQRLTQHEASAGPCIDSLGLLADSFHGARLMSKAVNVMALVRDGQRYVFLYDDRSVEHVLAKLAEFAEDSELDFTWYDAAVLSDRVRKLQAEEQESPTRDFPSYF